MSAAPKRGAHEEGVHSSSSSMRPGFGGEEGENPGFPRVNYGVVQESRPGLLPRPESRDGERRSPLHSMYKMPGSVMDTPHSSHPVAGAEIRAEMRDPKDVRDSKGVESNRDIRDPKEVRDTRGVESNSDSKSEVQVEKDVYGAAGIYSRWKDQHRVSSQTRVRTYDAYRHASLSFHKKEPDEGMGENRVDFKGDKERKRKEGKHHDWLESDKERSDQKNNMQVGSSINFDLKEITREDKDVIKDKERPEEREKDHVDREGRNGGEKEGGYQNEKEIADKTYIQENVGSEQKKPSESCRNMEIEAKEIRGERDADVEGERSEKCSRGFDKESDKGGADVNVSMDRDRDAFGSAVQQRKRMLRPRGNSQVADRDGRFKSRGQDRDG